jgi:hypothetical protein
VWTFRRWCGGKRPTPELIPITLGRQPVRPLEILAKLEKEPEESWRVKKSELLKVIQNEIVRHNLDTFMSAEHKIVQTGCSTCQKHFGTVEQFKASPERRRAAAATG